MSEYEKRARAFLGRHGLGVAATFKGDRCPPWCGEHGSGCCHGDRYRVRIRRATNGRSVSFDFWNSHNDCAAGKRPTAYDVLACISGDVSCPDTFDDFCGEYGYVLTGIL